MATERRRFMGELAAWQVAQIVVRIPFTGVALDADKINPYRQQVEESPAMVRLKKWQARRQLTVAAREAEERAKRRA